MGPLLHNKHVTHSAMQHVESSVGMEQFAGHVHAIKCPVANVLQYATGRSGDEGPMTRVICDSCSGTVAAP